MKKPYLRNRKNLTDEEIQTLQKSTERIPDFPAYHLSSGGHVYRLSYGRRTVLGRWKPHEVAGQVAPDGRKTFQLTRYVSSGPQLHSVTLEWLLATTYLGPPPTPEHQPRFRDSNPLHHYASNVRWALPTQQKKGKTEA